MSNELGKLYIVATPIGNLADMTFRAVEILKSVDCILCEDTRTTKKLLNHYKIDNKTISYHSHSKLSRVDTIIEMLQQGKSLALVSDAGTPCISDPGVVLVAKIREELGDTAIILPIPGPSALISALSVSGLPIHEFIWKGFIPHKKGREKFFQEILEADKTVVFYESVHRFMKTLDSLTKIIPKRSMVVGRELTKLFEEVVSGSTQSVSDYFTTNPDRIHGEFVIMIGTEEKK